MNGVFARAFKGDVQPVEIAARLQRELDTEAKLMSRDKRLVPNEFVVGLSEHDYDKLTPVQQDAHRRAGRRAEDPRPRHGLRLQRPDPDPLRARQRRTADRAAHGDLGGRGRPERPAAARPGQPEHESASRAGARGQRPAAPAQTARVPSSGGAPTPTCGSTIRASRGCTPRSRSAAPVPAAHAEIVDLGSTNGILVNGHKVPRAAPGRGHPDRDRFHPDAGAHARRALRRPCRSSRSPSSRCSIWPCSGCPCLFGVVFSHPQRPVRPDGPQPAQDPDKATSRWRDRSPRPENPVEQRRVARTD